MRRGLLLFAHGARDPNWALPFEAVVERIRGSAPEVAVALAYLDFMTPGIVDAGDSLAAAGCTRVEVVPLFLGAGGHVRKDLPELLARLRQAHPGTTWLLRPAIGEVESLTGRGLRATLNDRAVVIGNLRLMNEVGVPVSTAAQTQVDDLQSAGQTIMVVAVGGELIGVVALADTVRADAIAAIKALRQAGVQQTVMLTGDNQRVASAIAGKVGLSSVRADLMPEDKVTAIRALRDSLGAVAMVGDGVNDAPALANATVGIAMGGAGTDVALETADVALMSDDLSKLPFAIGLGRATRAIITQNLIIALGVIGVLVIASLTGWAGIGVAILFHEGSTIVVVLNALRLLGYQPAPTR